MLSLAHRRYTKKPDPGTLLSWLIGAMSSFNAYVVRTDHALIVATIYSPPWWPDDKECHVVVLVADKGHHWDAVRLLRRSIGWARIRKCTKWRIDSETEHELGPLANYVGAGATGKKYTLDLDGH